MERRGCWRRSFRRGSPWWVEELSKQHNDRATQVPQQLTQKHADLFSGDVVVKE